MTLQITLNDSFILLEYTDEQYNIYRTTVDNNDMFVVNFMNKDISMLYDLLNNNDNYKIEKNTNNILLTYCKPIIIKYELKFINNNQNNNKITNLKNENIELKNKIKEITNTNDKINKELNNIKIKQNTKIINGNFSGFLCDYVLLDNRIISKNIEKIEIDFTGLYPGHVNMKTNINFISIDNNIYNYDRSGSSLHNKEEINKLIDRLENDIKLFTKIENLIIKTELNMVGSYYEIIISKFIPQIKKYENKISSFIFGCCKNEKQITFNNIDEIMDYYNRVGPFFK